MEPIFVYLKLKIEELNTYQKKHILDAKEKTTYTVILTYSKYFILTNKNTKYIHTCFQV